MTDEQINIRIAEVTGWNWTAYNNSCSGRYMPVLRNGHITYCPFYANSLDAIEMAEVKLTEEESHQVNEYLYLDPEVKQVFRATARQRAVYFLRAKGRYDEPDPVEGM